MSRVLIVIVNYRTGGLVVDCLRSLADEVAASDANVAVVDNASGDGSSQTIRDAIHAAGWSGWASLIDSPVNGGFAAGNNLAVRQAMMCPTPPDLFWLLNPDTRVRPGALATLVGFFDSKPRVGIAGSMIEEADGTPWPYAFRFPSILGELERGIQLSLVTRLLEGYRVPRRMGSEAAVVDWVSGASMMVRRDVFASVGLMDEDYFLYFEETDFCRAAQRVGWPCWYVPQAAIVHIAGQSTGVTSSDAGARRLPRYWFESRRRYFIRNYSRGYAIVADLTWLAAHGVSMLRRLLPGHRNPEPARLVGDFIANSAIFAGAPRHTAPQRMIVPGLPRPVTE